MRSFAPRITLTLIFLAVIGQALSLAATDDETLLDTFKRSDLLLVGTIAEVKEITTSNGVPPVYLMSVTFKDVKVLRGKEPAKLTISYQTSDPKEAVLTVGKKVIAASWMVPTGPGSAIRRSMLVEATDANLKLAATQPATAPASGPATSKPAALGGLQVTVISATPQAVEGGPLAIRVEIKNSLDRPARLYTNTSRWTWRFGPQDEKGYWTLSQQFAEARIWSDTIQPGKSASKSFATRSARGQEYLLAWVGEEKKQTRDFLPAGKYRLSIKMELSTFSRATTQPEPWEGELTTDPIDIVVAEALKTTSPK